MELPRGSNFLKEINERFCIKDMKNFYLNENLLKKSAIISTKKKKIKLKESLDTNLGDGKKVNKFLPNDYLLYTFRKEKIKESSNIKNQMVKLNKIKSDYYDLKNVFTIDKDEEPLEIIMKSIKLPTPIEKNSLKGKVLTIKNKQKVLSSSEILYPERYLKDSHLDFIGFDKGRKAIYRKGYNTNSCQDYYLKNNLYLEAITTRMKKNQQFDLTNGFTCRNHDNKSSLKDVNYFKSEIEVTEANNNKNRIIKLTKSKKKKEQKSCSTDFGCSVISLKYKGELLDFVKK